jgi:predicted CopG family antitoxin
MKTITLTEEAYMRLVAWKVGSKDSFSRVIDRVVPKRGTIAGVLEAAKRLPALSDEKLKMVEASARSHRAWKDQRDPWTS